MCMRHFLLPVYLVVSLAGATRAFAEPASLPTEMPAELNDAETKEMIPDVAKAEQAEREQGNESLMHLGVVGSSHHLWAIFIMHDGLSALVLSSTL